MLTAVSVTWILKSGTLSPPRLDKRGGNQLPRHDLRLSLDGVPVPAREQALLDQMGGSEGSRVRRALHRVVHPGALSKVDRSAAERDKRHDGKAEYDGGVAALMTPEVEETPHEITPSFLLSGNLSREQRGKN